MLNPFLRARRVVFPAYIGSLPTRVVLFGGLFVICVAAYFLAWPNAPVLLNDSPSYMRLASDIQNLRLNTLSMRTPGLPFLLILTGSAQQAGPLFYCASLALHFGAVALLLHGLFALGIARGMVWVVGALAILPPFVEPAAYVLTENFTQFWIVLGFYFLARALHFERGRDYIIASVGFALAMLTRPSFQLLPMCLVVTLTMAFLVGGRPRRSWGALARTAVPAMLVCYIPLALWVATNVIKFGFLGTCSVGPFTLSTKTVTLVEDIPPAHAELRKILVHYRDQDLVKPNSDHSGKDYIYRALPDIRKLFADDEVAVTQTLQHVYTELILRRPLSYLHEALRPIATYWMPIDYPLSTAGSTIRRYGWLGLQSAVMSVFFIQALVGAGLFLFYATGRTARMLSRDILDRDDMRLWRVYLVGLSVIWYCAAVSCMLGPGDPRYREPTTLLIFATTAIGLTIWRRLTHQVARHFTAAKEQPLSMNQPGLSTDMRYSAEPPLQRSTPPPSAIDSKGSWRRLPAGVREGCGIDK